MHFPEMFRSFNDRMTIIVSGSEALLDGTPARAELALLGKLCQLMTDYNPMLDWTTVVGVAVSAFSSRVFARAVFYPTLLWNVARQSTTRRWYDRIDSTVILGALPFKSLTKTLVEKENVKGVITLNEEYETRFLMNSKQEWQDWGVTQLCLETVDFNNAPSAGKIEEGLQFIETIRQDGHSVYVHCKAGRGRSVTLVACYLMKDRCLSPEEACTLIRSKRPHIRLGSCQEQALFEFHEQLTQDAPQQR